MNGWRIDTPLHVFVGHVGTGPGGFAHRLERAGEVVVAGLARDLHARPEARHRVVHVGHQRAADAHREVEARLVKRAVVRVEEIVEQVDAAAKADVAVDHTQLAVQPAPARRQKQAPALRGVEDAPVHAGGFPAALPFGRHVAGADAIDDDLHAHAASRGRFERLGDSDHRTGELEDVGLEHHLGTRLLDRLGERREQRLAAAEQGQAVAGPQRAVRGRQAHEQTGLRHLAHATAGGGRIGRPGGAHSSASSAISGRWSDMRAHATPRGTAVERHLRPRT